MIGSHPETHTSYLVVGGLCLAAGLPSWVLLATGKLLSGRNPNLLIPFFGVPAGIFLLLFGARRLRPSSLSDHGLRVAIIALAIGICLLGSWAGVRMGAEALLTSMRFCSMAASYLALLSFILLTAAALGGKRKA